MPFIQLKLPRILNLVRESSRPDENEVKSEAQFQRLVASFSELPTQPRTPRASSDRGRYPEEASEDRDLQPCETPSDDSDYDEPDGIPFAFAGSTHEPITIRTRTPAASVSGSLCGDDLCVDSPGAAMDIDMVSFFFSSHLSGHDVHVYTAECSLPHYSGHQPQPRSTIGDIRRHRRHPPPCARANENASFLSS